jgi:hypothetical protein
MFYVHTESGTKARVGNSFVLAGVKYPAKLVTEQLLSSLNFNTITPVGPEPSNTFYDTQGINVDGTWIKQPYPLASVKATLIKDNKTKMLRLLAECDWYVIQAAEGGDAVPAEVATYRAAVRTTFTNRETQINAKTSVDDLYNYVGAMGAVEASQPAWPDKPESMFIVEQTDCSVDYDCFCG